MQAAKDRKDLSSQRANLFSTNPDSIAILQQKGFTSQQLTSMSIERLTKLIAMASKIDKLLQFVTVDQITGKNHTSPQLPTFEPPLPATLTDTDKEFEQQTVPGKITIKHNKNSGVRSSYVAMFGKIKDDRIEEFDRKIIGKVPKVLVNSWYVMTRTTDSFLGQEVVEWYCPQRGRFLLEQFDNLFPMQEVLKLHEVWLMPTFFYNEIRFIKNFPELIPKYLSQHTNTSQIKLNALVDYQDALTKLLAMNISIRDLLKLEENQLLVLLSRFFDGVEDAINLVGFEEVAGWSDPNVFYTVNLFPPAPKAKTTPTPTTECKLI